MSFTIYPAIDMRGGKCVRLLQGDYDKETVYGDSPFEMAKKFVDQGAAWIHMVDLDGAKDGTRINDRYVLEAAQKFPAKVQVGGGIRSERDVIHYLENGVDRVIIGSMAVSDRIWFLNWFEHMDPKLPLASTQKMDMWPFTAGWKLPKLKQSNWENGWQKAG